MTAGPPGRGYRFQKLVRRNKVTFVAGTLVVLALVGGLGTATWLYFRERDARNEQQRLRGLAEIRETVAQAAVKIHHGDPAGADALLAEVPVEQTPSSLEAANTFLAVGQWHVLAGRWEEASDRFASLARAMTSVDPSDTDNVSRHLLPAAATVCQSGNRERYEWIRKMAIERFAGTSHPVVAEQVVKATLLLPADEETLAALKPLAEIIERAIASGGRAYGNNRDLEAWSCLALALRSYREGDFTRATEWGNRCLAIPSENLSRSASVRIILAMIEHRSGRATNARAFLGMAGPPVRERFSRPMKLEVVGEGLWFDWVNARILLREASELMGE